MGDLLPFIYAKAEKFDYLGVDIVPEFIEVAKKRYEGHDFRVLDPFTEDVGRNFDIVVLCGALNANKTDWLENRKTKIKRLYELADKCVAFNMAASFEQVQQDQRVAYANPKEILDFCSTLTPRIILKTHYHPKDITIVLFKN
jgi:hypothetical protein